VLAHHPVYAATLNPSFPEDFERKVEKAKAMTGPRFFHIFAPCSTGWRFDAQKTIAVGRIATDTGVFPLYEVEEGRCHITRKSGTLKPVEEYLRAQGRFRHLTPANIAAVGVQVRASWDRLLQFERESLVAPTPTEAPIAPPATRA